MARTWNLSSARRKAFTIYELLFVVVIIGILFVTVLPRIVAGDEQTALQTTANNIARLSAFARQSAISVNDTVTLTIIPEDRVWFVDIPRAEDERRRRRVRHWEDREPRTDEEQPIDLHKRLEFHEILIDGEETRDKEIVIRFYPSGNATQTQIILESKRKKSQMTVEIEGATGQVSAYRGEPKEFADVLEEAGIDSSGFSGVSRDQQQADREARIPGEGFSLYAGGTDERKSYYQDAASRIMGRTTRLTERQRLAQEVNGGTQ